MTMTATKRRKTLAAQAVTAAQGSKASALTPQQFGAKGNGIRPDDAAFVKLGTAAKASKVAAYPGGSDSIDRGRVNVELPPGRYLLTEPGSLMNATTGARIFGLHYKGAGRGLTEIVFMPSVAGQALLINNDIWLGVTFEGISFICAGLAPIFWASESDGGAQDYRFVDCTWDGAWNAGMYLTGTNCNSEFYWDQCSIQGSYATGYLCLGTDEVSADEDEFLNYWFTGCKVYLNSGYFINGYRGGSITVRDSSLIALGDAIFFYFPFVTHADSVCRLLCEGTRFELRTAGGQIIVCYWQAGIVQFNNCSNSSEASSGDPTAIRAVFVSESTSMPLIEWNNCELEGKHQYFYEALSCNGLTKIKYSNSWICNHDDANDFIQINALGGTTNAGGQAVIEFENCRGSATEVSTPPASIVPFDCVVGWSQNIAGRPKIRSVRFGNAHGDSLPVNGTDFEVWLPKNSVPLRLLIYKPSGTGSATSTTWTYTLQTNEGTPTDLASVGLGTAWDTTTIHSSVNIDPYMLSTNAMRHLSLVAANITQTAGTPTFAILEYLA